MIPYLLNETLTVWYANDQVDNFGNPEYNDGVVIKGRLEQRQKPFLTTGGTFSLSTNRILTADPRVGDFQKYDNTFYIAEGNQEDVPLSSAQNEETYVTVEYVKNIAGTFKLWRLTR